MITYIESNFILELAFVQEEFEACDTILHLAETGRIDLVLPSFCIGEPYGTLVRQSKRRSELQTKLSAELAELGRSKPYQEVVEGSSEIIGLLGRSADESKRRLESVLGRILNAGQLVQMDAALFGDAVRLQETRSLGPQDAIVYASVLRHLANAAAGPKCFLNRNSKDFLTPDIEADLSAYHCRVIPSFTNGLGSIRTALEAG